VYDNLSRSPPRSCTRHLLGASPTYREITPEIRILWVRSRFCGHSIPSHHEPGAHQATTGSCPPERQQGYRQGCHSARRRGNCNPWSRETGSFLPFTTSSGTWSMRRMGLRVGTELDMTNYCLLSHSGKFFETAAGVVRWRPTRLLWP